MMKALTLPRGTAGKSLLTLASLVLLLGLVAGEAAAATAEGKVTLDGGTPVPSLTVVATTAAPKYCFLNQGTTSTADGRYSFSLPGAGTCLDGTTDPLVAGSSKVLVFVHNSNPQIVSHPNDSIEKSFTYTGTSQAITADFTLVTGKPLEGNVADLRTGPADPADQDVKDLTVFATNGPSQYKFLGQTLTAGTGCSLTLTCGDYTLFAAAGQQVELAVDTQDPKFVQRFPDGVVDPAFIRDFLDANSGGCASEEKWCLLFFDIVKAITISGVVSDAGTSAGIGNARVDAFLVEGANEEIWTWLAESFTSNLESNLGSYSIQVRSNLVSVRLTVNKTGYLEGIEDVPLAGTDQPGVGIALVREFINVTVHVTDTSSPPQPIGGASVTAIQGGSVLAAGPTNSNGDFVFLVKPNSSVTIQVSKTGFLSASQSVAVGVADRTVNFALTPVPTTADDVDITKAVWKAGTLTVFATSSAPGPENPLTATAVSKGGFTTPTFTMNFNSKRKQYELRVPVSINLVGGTVTVTSSLKGTDTAPITSK